MGNELDIGLRYNALINSLFLTMVFSAGMPILYPIAASYTFLTYWVDKYLVLRHYRKAPTYDARMGAKTAKWFKFAWFFHAIVGFFMISNS